jgi:hypothetical protein
MKRLFVAIFFMIIALQSFGQLMQENLTSNAMRRVLTKNGFRLPQSCGFPATPNLLNYTGDSAAGALVYDTCNGLIGAWDGEKWISLNVTKSGFLIIPQVTYAGFELTYDVTPGAWLTNGVLYASNDTTIILSALASVDSSRTDVFVAESTGAGQISTITGTESANPLTPQTDPSYQLFITHVTLNPSNQTAGVDTVLIYDNENIPPEFTGSATGVTVNFGGLTNPYRGTKTTDVSAINSGDIIKYTNTSTKNQTQYDGISFYIRLKAAMPSNNNIYVSFFNGASQVSNEIAIPLNKTNTTTYQGISIAMASFSFTNSLFDAVRYRYSGSGISGLYLDFIYLQNGIVPIVIAGDYVKSVRRRAGTDTVEMLKDNGWEFAFIDSTGGGGSGITQLTGDVTAGPGSGSQTATLATVNSNVGTFKKATVTANGKGLVTAIAEGMGVDTIYRKLGQDSIFYKINGGTERAVKDSIGGAGASPGGNQYSIQYNRNNAFAGNANFVFDSVNSRVGIGTASPASRLHISGFNTAQSNLTAGNIELQAYATDNLILGFNTYYNGGYLRRLTGRASKLHYGDPGAGELTYSYTNTSAAAGTAPTFISAVTFGNDGRLTVYNAANTISSFFVAGGATGKNAIMTASTSSAGGLGLQSLDVNNNFITSNSYWSGSNFTRIGAGYAGVFWFNTGEGMFNLANTSTAGSTFTNQAQFKVSRDGSFGVGPTVSTATATWTGSNLYMNATGQVGIGNTAPATSAKLELTSTTQALIITRMTSTQASAMIAAAGMMVYVTDTNGTFTAIGFWGYENGAWVKL